MTYHYEVIAKMAADFSKQLLKLNHQLDKVIDKQDELIDPQAQKVVVIDLVNSLKWEAAAKLCAEQAKEESKRSHLADDEQHLRRELEALREQLVRVAGGELFESTGSAPA